MKPHAPPRVNGDLYDALPEISERCAWWMDRIRSGWRRNRRISTMGYYVASAYFGVYIWEYVHVLSPLLRAAELASETGESI